MYKEVIAQAFYKPETLLRIQSHCCIKDDALCDWALTIAIKDSLLMRQSFFICPWFHSCGHQSIDLLCSSFFCFEYEFNNSFKWFDEVSV